MGNYKKKASEINAIKVSEVIPKATNDWYSLPNWVRAQYDQGNLIFGNAYLIINGGDAANFNEWLIEDEKGNLSRCSQEDFDSNYEEVKP